MENEILFTEKQRFSQWWLWIILAGTSGLLLYAVFTQVIGGHPFGDKPASDAGLLIVTGLVLLLTYSFVFLLRLETEIKKDGIYVRFFPFQWSFRYYEWDKLSKSYIRQYNPILEYGGWGFRMGVYGKGRALNVSGNKGLQLVFTDDKKLLIGTNKPEEMTETLVKLRQLKS